jgi:SAM-dependent methyltransferase
MGLSVRAGGERLMDESTEGPLEALREAIERFAGAAPDPGPPAGRERWLERGTAPDELRWREIDRTIGDQITGRRVLVVGHGVDYDAFAFASRGAEYVLACEAPLAIRQAAEREPRNRSTIDFRPLAWDELDPERHGTFGIIHCNGLLHRVLDPIALLRTLRRVTEADGTLLVGSVMISDPERSEYLRFIPSRFLGDPSWGFLPGRLAFRWLLQTAGFDVGTAFGEHDLSGDGIPLVSGYLQGTVSPADDRGRPDR